MVRMTKSFYSRILIYSILLVFSHVIPSFAAEKFTSVPLLTYTGNLRVLNIDLETLDPKEPLVDQLYKTIEKDLKKHPAHLSENHFVLGYLNQLQDKDDAAHDHFQLIAKENPLYGTSLFFDGISLRKIGLKSAAREDQEKNCKNSMDTLDKVNELAPSYFANKEPNEMTSSTYCYFDAVVQKGVLMTQDEQWFQNTLKSSSWFEPAKREGLYFKYLDVMKAQANKQQVQAYLEFGFTLFPKNARLTEEAKSISMPIPQGQEVLTKAEIAKTEVEAQALFQEAKNFQARNDLKPALQKWSEVISKYPGSYTGENAKQEIMSMIKNEVKWKRPTTAYNDDLKKLPPEMIFDLAKYLWNQDYNMTAYSLYMDMIDNYPYHDKTAESYYSVARMHEDWSEWSKAIKYYSSLVEKYPRSKYFERAHFKVGFLLYMNQEYIKAIDWLAKEKTLVTDPHNKAQACYWLGRTYEKMKKKSDADAQYDEIRQKYPLTYYSFLLGIDPSAIKKSPVATPQIAIEKGHPLYLPKLLLAVGLHKPARAMIQAYGNENDEHLLQIVQLFHDSGFHMFSMPNALSLSEKRMDTVGLQEDLVKMIFPVKYLEVVEKEAKTTQTDPFVILSLIKQESGYFERAVSASNAIGLMQLLVPTAQTLAKKEKQPLPAKDDLFDPEKNIQLGSYYISGLNQQFTNDIVLVLSAYNAGPDRAIKWKNRWPNVRKDEFVELIPFQETRVYVKLILRNYSYYKYLVQNKNVNIADFGF
jgi:TolA-binding protein